MAKLNPGITPPGEGDGGVVWNILGQTYYLKASSDNSFAFEVHGQPGTFVPPHVHPTQDEFIYLLEGEMELTLDGHIHRLAAGGLARMPMGMPHGYANVGSVLVRALFWVSPARKLHELFSRIDGLTDPAEVVRISATCEVDFLPPPVQETLANGMTGSDFTVGEARPDDAPAIATIHLTSRQQAMPYLRPAHTDDETRTYFARVVGDRRRSWWVVRYQGQVAAFMLIDGEHLDHVYVSPCWQGRGFGSALIEKAKTLSPDRLTLWTFQRNERARSFYEARGFRRIKQTDGENEEGEPDVQYEWRNAPHAK